jgi:hypothetical protein
VKIKVIIPIVIALAVLGGFIGKYREDNIRLSDLLIIKEEQSAFLEYQIQQYEGERAQSEDRIEQYKEQVASYKEEISQLEDIIDFNEKEAQHWETLFHEKATGLCGYNEFSSVEELEQWLEDDPISEHEWHPNYDCDNFAIDLTLSALADGYWIGLGASDDHLFNFTIIGNDVYRIEASQDKVEPWGTLD